MTGQSAAAIRQAGIRTPDMQRLKTRAEFQAVMAAPVVARTAHFALHRLPEPAGTEVRIGAVTPKRLARRSVTRNALKRQIYTVTQSLTFTPGAASFVVRLRSEFSRRQFSSATSAALKAAARAELDALWSQVAPR